MTLAHALVTASDGAPPERWMLFLHGIFGTGANWRTIARRFVAAAPSWGAVLVDLRMHGRSQGLAPPHTVAAAADDLVALARELPGGERALGGVVGHSFGGKVALELVRALAGDLDVAYVVDATPGPRPDARGSASTVRVLDLLDALPPTLPTREAFSEVLARSGLGPDLVGWLAMNVVREGGAFRFGLDLVAIRALLDDYFARDLWSLVDDPPGRVRLELVIGGASTVFDDADRAHAHRAAEARPDRVRVHVVPGASHWVHVDAPDALVALVTAGAARSS